MDFGKQGRNSLALELGKQGRNNLAMDLGKQWWNYLSMGLGKQWWNYLSMDLGNMDHKQGWEDLIYHGRWMTRPWLNNNIST